MSEDGRRAVRPRWICGTSGEGVEQGADDWGDYAKQLKNAVMAKREGPGGEEKKEEEDEELEDEAPEEHGQR